MPKKLKQDKKKSISSNSFQIKLRKEGGKIKARSSSTCVIPALGRTVERLRAPWAGECQGRQATQKTLFKNRKLITLGRGHGPACVHPGFNPEFPHSLNPIHFSVTRVQTTTYWFAWLVLLFERFIVILRIFIIPSNYVSLCMYVHPCTGAQGCHRHQIPLGLELQGLVSCSMWGYWEPNSRVLEKRYALLTLELPFQPLFSLCVCV